MQGRMWHRCSCAREHKHVSQLCFSLCVSPEIQQREPLPSSVFSYALTGPLTRNMVGPIPSNTHVPASIGIHSLLRRCFPCHGQDWQ